GNPQAVRFPPSQIKHPDRRLTFPQQRGKHGSPATVQKSQRLRFDFSYSGIKTAVLRHVETHNLKASIEARRQALSAIPKPNVQDYVANCDPETLDLIASFQRAMVDDVVSKTLTAAREYY